MDSRDLISRLPDEVLGKILSLLRTQRAVSTSVLSKSWKTMFALVENLDFHYASGDPSGFCDFVDKTLVLLSNSPTLKRFSLNLNFELRHDVSRVNSWICTALERGCLELHLENIFLDTLQIKFFTSNTLVKLTICNALYSNIRLPSGSVMFPALKTLSFTSVLFPEYEIYLDFISGCPVLEDLSIHYSEERFAPNWCGAVLSPSIKRLTIYHNFPSYREAQDDALLDTPSVVYLDYSNYVAEQYDVSLDSLVEARLDIRSWEKLIDVEDCDTESDDDSVCPEPVFGDVTNLVAGISNLQTLHLSPYSLEVFHFCCKSMPAFHNLLTLSVESDKERGWQVLPLLINNSPNLETLIFKGLVHQVTHRCGDACACIPKRKQKKKKKKEEGVCCLSTCRVKVLNISGYRGTCTELKQMKYFLGNLKCLETVNVGVKMNHQEDDDVINDKYLRITDALMKLPRVSSNCGIHIF